MSDTIRKIGEILEGRDRKKIVLLFFAILIMALLEVGGIAAVMPFMSLVAQPELAHENRWLRWVYETFRFDSQHSFLIATGIAVLIFITLANGFALFTRWMQVRISWGVAHSLSVRLAKTFTAQPYVFFLMRNSSDMGKQVLAEVQQFVTGFLLPLLELGARSILTVLIFVLLIAIDPDLAISVFIVVGGLYALIYAGIRRHLVRMGKERLRMVQVLFKTANELLGGIKAVKVHNSERHFTGRFVSASRRYTRVQANHKIISQAPKFLIEIVAFGGIIVVVLYLLAREQDFNKIIPVLSLYALAAYRLLPALQIMYGNVTALRYNYTLVDEIYRDLRRSAPALSPQTSGAASVLCFERNIMLRGVTYFYPGIAEPALRDISLRIEKGTSVAFAGSTGSGKTTLVDIILGLLDPHEGQLLIDDVPLTSENVRQWRRLVGYVPQDVFFFDDTIARNIAFGEKDEHIDQERVRWAARIANIGAFVEEELPSGYGTEIGERGVRLSGGERQRLGLARALYHQPRVLIFDEATSALDGITEEAVMQAISNLPYEVTMITIAHRLATVRDCDFIYLLEHGRIVEQGSYQELVEANKTFREMARLTI